MAKEDKEDMERKIDVRSTNQGCLDRILNGEAIEYKDANVIGTVFWKNGKRKIYRILSEKPLNEKDKRRFGKHVRDVSMLPVEFGHNREEFLIFRDKWIAFEKMDATQRLKEIYGE